MGDDKSRPHATIPPAAIAPKMSERTLRKTLEGIETAQESQALLEAERAGAAKFRARLQTIFGGVLTAAAIGLFVWVWDAQASNQAQDAAIHRVEERARDHDPTPPGHEDLEAIDRATERRVGAVEASTKSINDRLGHMEADQTTRHTAILEELRRLRGARRTWGGR